MTSWDQQGRGRAGGPSVDPAAGQPMSRRAAREAERRAAEAVAERQPHPSGVVDFEAHDFGAEFAPDQEFNVGDTQDIWAALTRGRRSESQPQSPVDDLGRFRSGVPEAPQPLRDDTGSVSGDLLDRVRDAVLRRPAEAPSAWVEPIPGAARPALDDPGSTRRQRRERDVADLREDGLPNELFDVPRRTPDAWQQPAARPEPAALPHDRDEYDDYDDGYYDEPYAPEPTIAIPLTAMDLGARSTTTNPISLPQSLADPIGDDVMTFSNPVTVVPAEAEHGWGDAQVDPAFIEPADPWAAHAQPRTAAPMPAQPRSPFMEPASRFPGAEVGPPSEVTDLAGFEALIRKARQQPAGPQPAAPQPSGAQPSAPAAAWADDDAQEGFTGLLSRSVQGSHGSSNALILPSDPQPDLTQAPLTSNGDIFITGSMNLSRSLSTTGGQADLYDSHEIDRLYEAAQDEPASGVAPVRATRAVSGGTQHDRQIVGQRRGRGNVLPTVLAIVAGAMAVGVVALLIGSWMTGLL